MKPPKRERRTAFVYEVQDTSRFAELILRPPQSRPSRRGRNSKRTREGSGVLPATFSSSSLTATTHGKSISVRSAGGTGIKEEEEVKKGERGKGRAYSTHRIMILNEKTLRQRRALIGFACRTLRVPLWSRSFAFLGIEETSYRKTHQDRSNHQYGDNMQPFHSRCKWQCLLPFMSIPINSGIGLHQGKRRGPRGIDEEKRSLAYIQVQERDGFDALKSLSNCVVPDNVRIAITVGDASCRSVMKDTNVGRSDKDNKIDDDADIVFVNLYEPPTATAAMAERVSWNEAAGYEKGGDGVDHDQHQTGLGTSTLIPQQQCGTNPLLEEDMATDSSDEEKGDVDLASPVGVWVDFTCDVSNAIEMHYTDFASFLMEKSVMTATGVKGDTRSIDHLPSRYCSISSVGEKRSHCSIVEGKECGKRDGTCRGGVSGGDEVDLYMWTLQDKLNHEVMPIRRVPLRAIDC